MFAWCGVGLSWEIDGHILLERQDAQFQLADIFGQPPQSEEEGSPIVEVVGYEFAVGIQACHIAAIVDAHE